MGLLLRCYEIIVAAKFMLWWRSPSHILSSYSFTLGINF